MPAIFQRRAFRMFLYSVTGRNQPKPTPRRRSERSSNGQATIPIDTSARIVRSYHKLFSGYGSNPRDYLQRTFAEVGGKLTRIMHGLAPRMPIQEKLSAEIADVLQDILQPQCVGVVIAADYN